MVRNIFFILLLLCPFIVIGQYTLQGKVVSANGEVPFATILVKPEAIGVSADGNGAFVVSSITVQNVQLKITSIGYETQLMRLKLKPGQNKVEIELIETATSLNEVVVTGTLKEVHKLDSPVPVEVFTTSFFEKNPTPTLYDAMQNINGVRPQLNCNVCNTGDIHINGLEGPYTMIMIDGMPIVSGLSTVYGLSGIPNALIDRVEVVKGPASSLYGSEAVGGLINVITKRPSSNDAMLSMDVSTSSWAEHNIDIGHSLSLGSKTAVLTGINYFNYNNPLDNNADNFTDVTQQNRVSIFQKWAFNRKDNRIFTIAGRYLYEDRWGGEMQWGRENRGGNEIYGESIYTNRWELIGNYQLPVKPDMMLSFSYNDHNQDSYYGDTPFLADQKIAFGQLTFNKTIGKSALLIGSALRYTSYDDNTAATASGNGENQVQKTWLPGVFVQNEMDLHSKHKLLLGMRYDYNSNHGNIFTPRIAYKWSINDKNYIRLNAGTGFRVVNLFTEEHAALTGAREVVIEGDLNPEQSYNLNLNYIKKVIFSRAFLNIDASIWHTYFNNQILPDYDTDPNKIIYSNLDGHAVSQGVAVNVDLEMDNGLQLIAGGSLMDVYNIEKDDFDVSVKERPILTERFTATWSVSYPLRSLNLRLDYTGNLYGPMRLPLQGALDPRDPESPVWSIQNIQCTWKAKNNRVEIYGGIKNLLNFTPPANSISRPHDPFDKEVVFDSEGNAVATPENPYALTFDPTYVYAPNQGIRGFLGIRCSIK